MSHAPRSTIAPIAFISAALILAAGCASSSPAASTADNAAQDAAIIHHVSAADRASTQGKHAIASDSATLWVNGLSCPQCASNVDVQLLRVAGVSDVRVDLSTGKIAIAMQGDKRPTPAQLARAVEDAGFTLAKIETP